MSEAKRPRAHRRDRREGHVKRRPLLHRLPDGRDWLLPHERGWRAVWRTWRWREALGAVLCFALIMALIALAQCGGGIEGGPAKQGSGGGTKGLVHVEKRSN